MRLTMVRRSSVSPLHADLRFAKPGAARYKDHLLLTAWQGSDKNVSPISWIRLDSAQWESTIMNGRCLRVGKEFLALVDYRGSELVVKLPQARVAELIRDGVGKPFAPAGRVFKEWVSVPKPERRRCLALLKEAIASTVSR